MAGIAPTSDSGRSASADTPIAAVLNECAGLKGKQSGHRRMIRPASRKHRSPRASVKGSTDLNTSTNTSTAAYSRNPNGNLKCSLRSKLGLGFFLLVIFGPTLFLSGRDALARCRAHGALLHRGSRSFRRRGLRFASQLPPNVGDLFCELIRLMLIPD